MFCGIGRHALGGGLMGFMMLFWLVLIGAAVYFIYKKYNSGTSGNNEALELLKLKFVKGEITEEEYINKKSVLMKK
jgi:putative membrane protein